MVYYLDSRDNRLSDVTLAPREHPQARFTRAYQAAVAHWPVPVTPLDVPTSYGTTHLLACGAATAPALLLLPGGGATATAWRALAARLAARYRVIAADPVGQPGLSSSGSSPLTSAADLTSWLDELLTGLGVTPAALIGHSYGAWLALRYTIDAPGRVERLVLLDPTDCFAPLSMRYRLRAIPLMARPSAGRMNRFLAWETGGRPLDPRWLAVVTAGQDAGRFKIVLPKRPRPAELARLRVPVLVVTAARSRAHDPRRIARRAQNLLPDATVVTLPRAAHHSIPTEDTGELHAAIEPFLAAGPYP